MAVTLGQLEEEFVGLKDQNELDSAEVTKLEHIIDNDLKITFYYNRDNQEFVYKKGLTIGIPEGLKYGTPIYNRIIARYRNAGWDVEYSSYDHDHYSCGMGDRPGIYLIFKPRRERK